MSQEKRMERLHTNLMQQWPALMMTVVVGTMSVDSFATREGKAEIVKAHCTLTRERQKKTEVGDCHFRQAFGNVQIWMGERWAFDFPASELGKSYQRDNQTSQISFTRKGQYTLIIDQSRTKTQENPLGKGRTKNKQSTQINKNSQGQAR